MATESGSTPAPPSQAAADAPVSVCVVYAHGPREVDEIHLSLSGGSTVAFALQASGLLQRHPDMDLDQLTVAVWGRKTAPDLVLRDGDRLELCRGLRVDPKVARRERFVRQGSQTAGLFAQRRPGAKAGY